MEPTNKGGCNVLELIKELQWIDIREYDQEMIKRNLFCPACGAAKVIGHHPWCKIKDVLDDVVSARKEAQQIEGAREEDNRQLSNEKYWDYVGEGCNNGD